MKKSFIGNEAAFQQLTGYLRMTLPGPVILSGKKGLGKREAALDLAGDLLCCDKKELSATGDFYLLDKKKETVKVEDILALLDKSTIAALGKRKVFIICHAEKMNIQAQNKLLKLLEDKNSTNILILITEQDTLLETIKSRCLTVQFLPLSEKEMKEYLYGKKISETEADLLSFLSGGCPYCLDEIMEYFSSLKSTLLELKNISEREEMLRILHLTKEKDANEFYTIHSEHYNEALSMFQYLFYRLLLQKTVPNYMKAEMDMGTIKELYTPSELLKICEEISRHQKQWFSGAYSKNDFFDLIRYMIQVYS